MTATVSDHGTPCHCVAHCPCVSRSEQGCTELLCECGHTEQECDCPDDCWSNPGTYEN